MKKKEFIEQGKILLILLAIVFLIYCVSQFFLNWHNLDLIHNIQVITIAINEAGLHTENGTMIYLPFDKITDTGSDYVSRPLIDYYISSGNNLQKYFIYGLLDMLFLGLLLGKKL